MGKGEGENWNNGLFGCFSDMGNCKFIGETQYCNFAKPYRLYPIQGPQSKWTEQKRNVDFPKELIVG